MLNEINANKVIEATSLVRKGRIYDLGRILDEKIPVFSGRAFKQVLITSAHMRTGGVNKAERRDGAGTRSIG